MTRIMEFDACGWDWDSLRRTAIDSLVRDSPNRQVLMTSSLPSRKRLKSCPTMPSGWPITRVCVGVGGGEVTSLP